MSKLKKLLKILSIFMLIVASATFSSIVHAEGEDYPLDPSVTFSLKVTNTHREDVTTGTIAKYGDYVYVKVVDNNGKELDINLFDIETNDKLISYGFSKGKYLVKGDGVASIKLILRDDPLARESSVVFSTYKGPIININFMFKSYQELWYVTDVIGNNQFRLDYNNTLDNHYLERSRENGNIIEGLSFICGYSNDDTAHFIGYYPTADELEIESSNTNAVKAYKTDKYGDIYPEDYVGKLRPVLEIVGNGTATVTVTYKNEIRPKTSVTIIVENYPNKDDKTDKDKTKEKTQNTDTLNTKKSDSIVTENNKIDITDNKLEVSEIKNNINIIYFIIPLVAGSVLVALFFILGKDKKTLLISGIIVLVLGLVIAGIYVVKNNKVRKYNEVINLYLNDNNTEAIKLLNEKDDATLYEDCKNRAFIEYLLLDNYEAAKSLINDKDSILLTYIDNYKNAQNDYDKYRSLASLVNELHQKTNYKYKELEELVNKEIKVYLQNVFSNVNVGDSFKFGNYNFKVIEKADNKVYAIPDECIYSGKIDTDWKSKTLTYFNNSEKEFINNLILLSRKEYQNYKKNISIADHSWWLDDISSVTAKDDNGNVHSLRYYVVGKDSEHDRGTAVIQDEQITGEQSYSYADNESIWVRPVIEFSVNN